MRLRSFVAITLLAASTIADASCAFMPSGFSTSRCFPASAALIAHSACCGCGVAMYTASTSGSASSAS